MLHPRLDHPCSVQMLHQLLALSVAAWSKSPAPVPSWAKTLPWWKRSPASLACPGLWWLAWWNKVWSLILTASNQILQEMWGVTVNLTWRPRQISRMTILDRTTWIPRDRYSSPSVSPIHLSLSRVSPLLSRTPAAPYTLTSPSTFPLPTTPHTATTSRSLPHPTCPLPQPPPLPPAPLPGVAPLPGLSSPPPWVPPLSLFSVGTHPSSAPCRTPIRGLLLQSAAAIKHEVDLFGIVVEEVQVVVGGRGQREMGFTEESIPLISWSGQPQ